MLRWVAERLTAVAARTTVSCGQSARLTDQPNRSNSATKTLLKLRRNNFAFFPHQPCLLDFGDNVQAEKKKPTDTSCVTTEVFYRIGTLQRQSVRGSDSECSWIAGQHCVIVLRVGYAIVTLPHHTQAYGSTYILCISACTICGADEGLITHAAFAHSWPDMIDVDSAKSRMMIDVIHSSCSHCCNNTHM